MLRMDLFERRNYRRITKTTIEIFELKKMDLWMRFIMAYRNGFAGIRYDDEIDIDKLQMRLDQIFHDMPKHTFRCRRLYSGGAVIYRCTPTHMYSYIQDGFASHEPMENRCALMKHIRDYKKEHIPRLFDMAMMSCSTREHTMVKYLLRV